MFAWLYRTTRWNWALKWYGILGVFTVTSEADAGNGEHTMRPEDGATFPEASGWDRNSSVVMPYPPRAERRIPKRMLVKLFHLKKSSFEITRTVDVSAHGARVVSKRPWEPNLDLSFLSISGKLYSSARVAHCESRADGSYVVGLELFRPSADWAEVSKDPLRLDELLNPA